MNRWLYWGFQVLGFLCQLVTLMKLLFVRVLPLEYESNNRVGDLSVARVVCTEGYVFPGQWTRSCFSYNAAAGDASSRFVVLDGKFWLQVCKKDGCKYPPKVLYAMVCCFKRFCEQNSIHGNKTFNRSRSDQTLTHKPVVVYHSRSHGSVLSCIILECNVYIVTLCSW